MKSLIRALKNPPKQSGGSRPSTDLLSREDAIATRSKLVNDPAFRQSVVDGNRANTEHLNHVDKFIRENGGELSEGELKAMYPERYV